MRWLFLLIFLTQAEVAQAETRLNSDGEGISQVRETGVSEVALRVRAVLQGAYESQVGTVVLMRHDLFDQRLLPTGQPFNVSPFNYDGSEIIESWIYDLLNDVGVVDWVLLELRDPDDPKKIIAARAALLRGDGYISPSELGKPALLFSNVEPGQYYVSLRHRNHLGVMTATPVTFGQFSADYDEFSNDSNQVVPSFVDFADASTEISRANGRFVDSSTFYALLWAGDLNVDHRIIGSGPGNDINNILVQILADDDNPQRNINFRKPGYHSGDLNLDGVTVFSGPDDDVGLLLSNVLLHPDNDGLAGNYSITGIVD